MIDRTEKPKIPSKFAKHTARYDKFGYVGQIFIPFVFRFLTYLLSCILFLFALLYFVNYVPLLRAVCKFRDSLLSLFYCISTAFGCCIWGRR